MITEDSSRRDQDPRSASHFGVVQDVRALEEVEERLAAERNLLMSLIDNLPDYVYVKDAQGRYILDNIAHRRLLGITSVSELVGRSAVDFHPPELASQYAEDDEEVLHTGKPLVNREERASDQDGARRWHLTTKVPLRNKEGALEGLLCISRDITASRESEMKLRDANHELGRSQEELLKVLSDLQRSHDDLKSAQFQLIQAEKMQSVGRLAAGVAHEVKNPLAILGMGVEYLASSIQSSDPNVSLVLNDMTEAIQRADSIILGLLDFSVPRELNLRAENMSQVVIESLALVRHEIAHGAIHLEKDLAADLPPVWLDKQKIHQVMVNLLANATHAMSAGGTLTVRTCARPLRSGEIYRDAGSRLGGRFRVGERVVVTEVVDTGTGISEERLAKIYDPFFTTKPTGQGAGLGLSVTKKIVELHGGCLDIRNRETPGVVATIWFKI